MTSSMSCSRIAQDLQCRSTLGARCYIRLNQIRFIILLPHTFGISFALSDKANLAQLENCLTSPVQSTGAIQPIKMSFKFSVTKKVSLLGPFPDCFVLENVCKNSSFYKENCLKNKPTTTSMFFVHIN